jgi:hypothetical protein
MSDFNWCHNPNCHKIETQSRIRGTGDNKVLRTRKISLNSEYIRESIYAYFCNQNCLYGFLHKFKNEIANIRPVKKASETPIKIVNEEQTGSRYNHETSSYRDYTYTTKTIVSKGTRDNG